jgi:ATP synthase protein I
MAQGFKIAVELVVGVCFGGFVGWGLDRYFETSGPWFLIVFVVLGFAAGMLNVIRTAQRMQAEAESQQLSAPSVKDDDKDDR